MLTSFPEFPNDSLLVRHFVGDADPEVERQIEAWRHADPDAYAQARLTWDLSAGAAPPVATEQFLRRLRPQLDPDAAARRTESKRSPISRRPIRRTPWVGFVAGAVAVTVLVAGGILWRGGVADHLRPSSSVAAHEQYSPPGQRLRLQLADGTTVLLNSGSRIRYAADFGETSRTVELEGEALFTVSQDAGIPFEVKSQDVTTRVLGTVFAVRRHANDDNTRIVVAQGKVMAGTTVLTSGESAVGSHDGTVLRNPQVDITKALAWTTGQLVLDYVPLQDAVQDMERWFAIRIKIADPQLAQQPIHVTFGAETPQQALSAIATVLQARAVWDGDTVTLSALTR